MPTRKDRPAPVWVAALHAVTAVFYLVALVEISRAEAETDWMSMAVLVLLAVPQVVVPVLLRLRPGPLAYGAALMLAVANVATALVVAVLSLLAGPGLLPSLAVFVLVQVVLFLWAGIRAVRSGTAGIPAVLLGSVLTLVWPGVVHLGATVLWAGGEYLQLRAVLSRETDVRGAVVRSQRCLLAYRERTGGFPDRLDSLVSGDPPCLEPTDIEPSRGRTLVYAPGPPGADGRIASFELRAAVDSVGGHEGATMIGDERGFVARGDEVGTPPIEDAAYRTDGMPQWLERIRRCALSQSVDDVPPPALSRSADHGNVHDPCAGVAAADSLTIAYQERQTGYRLEYRADGGVIRAHARPVRWGETALRSYLMEDGRIHVTLADREARTTDPALPPCLPEYAGDCVPTPVEVPPVAIFHHDSVATPESFLRLSGGVVGAPDRKPQLEIVFECNAHPDSLPAVFPVPRVPGRYEAMNPATCRIASARQLPLGDSVILRMWMKKGGGYWAISDTIPYRSARTETATRPISGAEAQR